MRRGTALLFLAALIAVGALGAGVPTAGIGVADSDDSGAGAELSGDRTLVLDMQPIDGSTASGATPVAEDTRSQRLDRVAVERSQGASRAVDATGQQSVIAYTQRFSQHDRRGVFQVTHEYRLPSQLKRMEVVLPQEATVTDSTGFVRGSGNEYKWTGQERDVTLSYRMPANRSVDGKGPIDAPGRFKYVDAGEWALVGQPQPAHNWGWSGQIPVALDRTVRVDGEGAAGQRMVFFGQYREYTHEAHGQQFRLIVPRQASLAVDRAALFDSLTAASGALRVGDRDSEVFMIAAPTGSIPWGVRGLQSGPSDLWVRDVERLADPDNVWLHEYVHTRQDYRAESDFQWSTEGFATYYAALLTLEQERITLEQFRSHLSVGSGSRFEGAVLADPSTWPGSTNYRVGALVAAELDRRVRLATDGEQSFRTVFRRLNAHQEPVSADTFENVLAAVGGENLVGVSRRFSRRAERPDLWSERQHKAAFAGTPARIRYELADIQEPIRVSGPYRERSLRADVGVVLVPGERLRISTAVRNLGGTAGDYTAQVRLNGQRLNRQTGRLSPGGTNRLTFDRTFNEVGTYEVAIGTLRFPVTVREPVEPAIQSFDIDRRVVRPGEPVSIAADVRNDARIPGEKNLTFLKNGELFEATTVRVDGESMQSVTVETRINETGTYLLELADAPEQSVIVRVDENASTPSEDDSGPGFRITTVAGALLVIVLGVARRRRREPE